MASTPRGSARLLAATGITLAAVGLGDLALFFWPLRIGDAQWEFGTVAHMIDALPLPTMSMLLLGLAALGARGRGRSPRFLAFVIAVAVCALAILLAFFLLDIPVAFHALVGAPERPTLDPSVHSALMRVVAKTITFGAAYVIGWAAMARIVWTGSRRRF